MFSKLKLFISPVTKPLGIAGLSVIVGSAIGLYALITYKNRHNICDREMHMPAQGQQTMKASEQKKNVDPIDEVLLRKILPVHGVASTTEKQQAVFFATYPAQLTEVPAHIKNACVHYVGHVHPDVLKIALQAAKNMGITEPIFFYETASVCHAFTSRGFNRLGLHLSFMLAFHPDYSDKLSPSAKEKHIDYFFRHLYHELHHIKHKDDSCEISDVTHEEAHILGRHCEMRAELGGLWGAHTFHDRDLNMKAFYPEDDGAHPTAQDQLRYNTLLRNALSEDPNNNDPTVVDILAKQYLEEKAPVLITKLEKVMPDNFKPVAATA